MRIAIVEDPVLAAELGAAGHEVVGLAAPASQEGAAGALAACLLAFERRLRDEPPDMAIISAADDAALALALAAVKLGIHLARRGESGAAESVPGAGHVLALLADEALPADGTPTIRGT